MLLTETAPFLGLEQILLIYSEISYALILTINNFTFNENTTNRYTGPEWHLLMPICLSPKLRHYRSHLQFTISIHPTIKFTSNYSFKSIPSHDVNVFAKPPTNISACYLILHLTFNIPKELNSLLLSDGLTT